MRMAFVADVHVGNHAAFGGKTVGGVNARAARSLGALENACKYARQSHADAFCVVGDLFDVPRPTPGLLVEVKSILHRYFQDRVVCLIAGNHDLVSSDECALSVLTEGVPDWHTITIPELLHGVLMIPYTVHRSMTAELETATRDTRNAYEMIAIHAGVRDESTPPWLRDAHDAVDAELLGSFSVPAVAGNWHERKTWTTGSGVVQLGALCPTGFDNAYGTQTGYCDVFDVRRGALHDRARVCRAEFCFVDWETDGLPPPDSQRYFRFRCEPHEVDAVRAAIALAEDQDWHCAGYDFDITRAKITVATQDKVIAAVREHGYGHALARYVENMPLEAGVSRADVLAAVRRFARLESL